MKILCKINELYHRIFTNKCIVFLIKKAHDVIAPEDIYQVGNWETFELHNIRVEHDLKDILCKRFAEGETLYFATHQGRMISHGWRKRGIKNFYVYEIGCQVTFTQDITMLYDFWVEDTYRGQGIYKKMLTKIIADSKKQEDLVIFAEKNNTASLKGICSVGFEYIREISFLKRKISL